MKAESESQFLLTLRHNVGLESDIPLALEELAAICELASTSELVRVECEADVLAILRDFGVDATTVRLITGGLRKRGTVAVTIRGMKSRHCERIIRDSAFAQELVFLTPRPPRLRDPLSKKLSRPTGATSGWHGVRAITLSAVLDYSTKMVFNRGKGLSVSVGLDSLVDYLLDETQPASGQLGIILDAIAAKKTTLYLTHELHLYKGKFFPRMIRSLINRYVRKPHSLIVDPFVGSGTALLEASMLAHCSVGIDVDPTSVLISTQKLAPKDIDPVLMHDVCMALHDAVYPTREPSLFATRALDLSKWQEFLMEAPEPMRGRLIKRGTEEGYDLIGEVEGDSAKALCLIAQLPAEIQPLMRVCLSHALTKKLRLRFVGIGNGRFTIDVARVRVLDLFVKKAFHLVAITEVFAWLNRNGVTFASTEVIRGTAKEFDVLLEGRKADLVITSPPYIPASSGREHYARARAIPLVFTGAATVAELDHLDEAFIGEMSAQTDTLHLERGMPPTIRTTLEFLRTDEQRRPKYLPTLNYYVDLEKVLGATKRALADDGVALFVVATSHTFYVHKTKQIVHTVDAASAFAELGEKAGLRLREVINVPLKKSGGLNARPRSTDEYSESILVFAKQ